MAWPVRSQTIHQSFHLFQVVSVPANSVPANIAQSLKLLFLRSVSLGGADGRLSGMNGSINAASTERVLRLLQANVICDVGAAEGKFMMCAAISGIRKVIGVELTENIGYKMVLDAAVHHMKLRYGVEFTLDWIPRAVEEVRTTMEFFSYC